MLNRRLKFAEKSDRDHYIQDLQKFLKTFPDKEDNLNELKKSLKQGLDQISPSQKEGDKLFNNMQLTAVYAFEAAFLKEVRGTIQNKDKYFNLYQELYGEKTNFHKKILEFEKPALSLTSTKKQSLLKSNNNAYLISALDILSNPSSDVLQAKIELSTSISDLLQAKNQLTIDNGDEKQIVSFLSNIDPRILSNFVVNQTLEITNNKAKINVLHEAIPCAKAILYTTIDISKLALPAGTIAAATFFGLGASLPVTIGIGLVIFTSHLAYLQDKNLIDSLDQHKINAARNEMINKGIDAAYEKDVTDFLPSNVKEPIRFLNLESIISQSIDYIKSSYNKHRTGDPIPDTTNLADLFLQIFNHDRASVKPCSNQELTYFKTHSEALIGIRI